MGRRIDPSCGGPIELFLIGDHSNISSKRLQKQNFLPLGHYTSHLQTIQENILSHIILATWIVNQETDSFRHTLNVILCTCCFKSATPRSHLSQGSEMSLRGKGVRSCCDGSSDRSFILRTDVREISWVPGLSSRKQIASATR